MTTKNLCKMAECEVCGSELSVKVFAYKGRARVELGTACLECNALIMKAGALDAMIGGAQ